MSLGWGQFFGGIGEVIGKVTTFFPGRIERLKNERDRLIIEKGRLLREDANAKQVARLERINARLDAVNGLLVAKVND